MNYIIYKIYISAGNVRKLLNVTYWTGRSGKWLCYSLKTGQTVDRNEWCTDDEMRLNIYYRNTIKTRDILILTWEKWFHGLKSSDSYIFYREETHSGFPANTRHRTTVDPMPAHRLRLCANTKSTPAQRPVFAGNTSLYLTCLVYSFIQKYNKIKSFMSTMYKWF